MTLQDKRWPKVLASIVAVAIMAAIFVGYSLMYRSLGFPLWMRWLAPSAQAEPLPGKPEVRTNTKIDADWTIVGMNHEWMVLVAKPKSRSAPVPRFTCVGSTSVPRHSTTERNSCPRSIGWNWTARLDCMHTLMIHSFAGNNFSGGEF
ncbi:MAG: hypothetical protein ABL908_13745 [Hyphomicrobium sp.]